MVFIGIAGLIFLLDYAAKKTAEKKLKENAVQSAAGDKILFRKLHNFGIAFGWFENKKKITLLSTAILLGYIIAQFVSMLSQKGKTLSKLGYACLIGGGMNNLYDRWQHGYVTDYFSFNVKWEKLKKLVFNLSDLFIFLGAVLVGLDKVFAIFNDRSCD